MEIREKIIVKASWLAILGNSLLAVLKITAGLISGSMAVVADGIDSASDIGASLVTLFTARLISRPPNIKYPYGYEKADTLATKVLSFLIFFAGAQLGVSTIQRVIRGEIPEIPTLLAIWVTLFSIVSKLVLSYFLKQAGKKSNSIMLLANGKNMQNDVLISSAVLVGLFFILFMKWPVLDLIIAVAVSLWIMKVAIQMFLQTNVELMDGMKDPVLYREIFDAVKKVEGATNPHRVRVRKIGSFHMISMDIEVEPETTVRVAHDIAHSVEENIKNTLPNVYDIVVHIEPIGNTDVNEKFGITEEMVNDIDRKENKK